MNGIKKASVLLLLASSGKVMAVAPEGVGIRSFTYNGIGCPPRSAEMHLAPDDHGSMLLSLPNMLAEWGPNHPKVYSRQNCVITVDLAVPEGWQYSLDAWEAIGTVYLDSGLRAEVSLQYFLDGSSVQKLVHSWDGPESLDFTIRDYVPMESRQWSSCGAPHKLNMNTRIRVMPVNAEPVPEGRGLVELGRHWETNQFKLRLDWRRCSP